MNPLSLWWINMSKNQLSIHSTKPLQVDVFFIYATKIPTVHGINSKHANKQKNPSQIKRT